ncbi:hypothetical protein UFOVP204_175 [uncultured Caudovirales phage]|uniref:Uncharacterized protein n=1 Tax=uncultured Caudovirales phage TaxID=2100421 RepID=A0A6J7WSM2_9CAUD|nr:hypothetical protein UFOVP204_175 [uncultured Caudovirales phage]
MTASVTTNKNFKVKNGLDVAGNATFDSQVILGTTPLAFDTTSNRLQVYINNAWASIATLDDFNNQLSFMDIGLAIDYNGQPTYIVQANGVTPSGTSKFVDGGNPSLTTFDITFDAGII